MANQNVRHLLGISGGKDSAALAIYLHNKYPSLDIEYYWCDTGKELDETYQLVQNLEIYLGKPIAKLKAANQSHHDAPFDHFIEEYGGYIPSSNARWCTKKLKLEPFETFVGDTPVVSYVGIRDDEDREGYISKKSNIQSVFPFRKNLWSVDVVRMVLANAQRNQLSEAYQNLPLGEKADRILEIVQRPLDITYNQESKLKDLIDLSPSFFNHAVRSLLETTNYPLAQVADFPLLDNDDGLVRDDIFRILRESGVGVPAYYEKVPFQVNGKQGHYARSRSGCFFCFFQQKIEWVWLLEQHPHLYEKAMAYEKDGYQWMQDETLEELRLPDRVTQIKNDFVDKSNKKGNESDYLLDILADAEGVGCAACFI